MPLGHMKKHSLSEKGLSLNPYCIGYASWAKTEKFSPLKNNVLILIVLDMPLGPLLNRDTQNLNIGLNPYCIGYASWALF